MVKNPPANGGAAEDAGLILGSGRRPEGGNGSPLQRSCLENPMDRGAWWVTVQRVAKSQTQLSTSILNIVLCYVVSPCCLSALHIVVCICQSQTPHLSPIPLPLW